MIKVIGNTICATVLIAAVVLICWVAGMYTSCLAYFAGKVFFDSSMSVATQDNVTYATFAACLLITAAWAGKPVLQSAFQARRVRAYLAGLPGNLDYVNEDGLIEIFDIYTGKNVKSVWVSTL